MHCERCEELQEEIRQMRQDIAGASVDHLKFCQLYGMTPAEALIFSALHKRIGDWVSQTLLRTIVPCTKSEYADRDNLLKVRICRIRRKVNGEYRITNAFGTAYKLERTTDDTAQISIPAERAA